MRVPLGHIELPGGDAVPVEGQGFGPLAGKPAIVIAGLHGDATEGVAVALLLAERWAVDPPSRPVLLFGCLNPLAVLHGSHRWPGLDVDFATRLPGDAAGHAPDRIAAALFDHVQGAERVLELGAPEPGMWEWSHAEAWGDTPVPGLPIPVFRHSERPHPGSPGAWGAVRLRGGRTGRVHPSGVQALAACVQAWLAAPMRVTPGPRVHVACAERAGIFVARARPGAMVSAGEVIGDLGGQPLHAEVSGLLLAIRDKPTANVGSTLARVAATPAQEA